jgi:hypothetical protein
MMPRVVVWHVDVTAPSVPKNVHNVSLEATGNIGIEGGFDNLLEG